METTNSVMDSKDSGFGLKNSIKLDECDPVIQDYHQHLQRRSQRVATCTGFQQADFARALQHKKSQSNCYYKGKQISSTVPLPYFKIYGSGIYLFFAFLWQVSILFLMFTIISIAPITINYLKGSAFAHAEQSLQYYVTKASIGNYQYSDQTLSQQESIKYKIANATTDIIMCFFFLVFYIYWEIKSQRIVKQINKSIKLLSNSTLEVCNVSDDIRQADIMAYMSRFGSINEVTAVRDYSQQIELSKTIFDARSTIKQLQIAHNLGEQPEALNKISQIQSQAKVYENQLQNLNISKQQIIKFYVSFEKPQQRDATLNKFKPYKQIRCCQDPPPQQLLLNGKLASIQPCFTEPTGIIWQNVHVTWTTRWARMLLQFLIILLVVAAGFILISFMNVLLPPNKQNIDTQGYNLTSIQIQTNTAIVESWCIKNMEFSTTSPYYQVCYSYWKSYVFSVLIKIGIAIVIIILKVIIKIVMISIAKFQKYSTHTEQSVAIMTNLLITYISTTVLITFLMQANVFHISFKSIIKILIKDANLLNNLSQISQYYDLSSNWYRDIGYQIWFNVFTLSFIPHIFMPIVSHILECVNILLAKNQRLYRKMYEKIRPPQFEIQDNYANILMIILIGFVFGGGSPCMIVVSFVGLITRYLYFKYIFIRFCRVPKTYNEALNSRAISILKIILLIRCLLSIYMYGADGIFAMQKSTFMKWSQQLSIPLFSSIFVAISRLFLTWYYSMFVALFIFMTVFKELIVNNLIKCCQTQDKQCKEQQSTDGLQQEQKMSQRVLTKSYKLENNPDYIQILAIMKMRNRILNVKQSDPPTSIKVRSSVINQRAR